MMIQLFYRKSLYKITSFSHILIMIITIQLEILQNNLYKNKEWTYDILNDPDMKQYEILILQE